MLQLYELCRLCAQKKKQKLDLFSSLNDDEAKALLNKISLCVSVQVTREDLLPKMICFDCQRAVEQFHTFRMKCSKAEERLNKMLSLAPPSKLNVTRIKQECSEPDFQDTGIAEMHSDLPVINETLQFINLKPINNVKAEIDDVDNESNWDLMNKEESSDLIKIISEEMVSQQRLDDIKQPHIEIISENFNEEYKDITLTETNHFYTCDVKVIPESLITVEENLTVPELEINDENSFAKFKGNIYINQNKNLNASPEVKKPLIKADQGLTHTASGDVKLSASKAIRRRKAKLKIRSEDPIDEKYLTLGEDEVCDIDLEVMSALIKKKQDPNATLLCSKCNKSFKFFKCFKKHKEWHNSQPEVFVCEFCKSENIPCVEFSALKSLKNHILRKHSPQNSKKFECCLCHSILPSQGQLNAHFKKVHDESGVTCQTCGKKLKNQTSLKSHLKVHQNERPYVCDFCGHSFKWSTALKVHIMCHRREKNFLCSECGKKFAAKKSLIEHLNTHSGERPYVCEKCNASFTQYSVFSRHLYLHNENNRIHKCDECHLSFGQAHLLRQHLVRHTGLRPFKCSTCQSTFKSQSDLTTHSKIHREKQYGCRVCGKKFAVSKTLTDHMVRHTGIKHICPVPGCGKTYTQRFSLTKHFNKQHSSLSIVRKKSGKRSHLSEDPKGKLSHEQDFIRYDFKEKEQKENSGWGGTVRLPKDMEIYYFKASPPSRAVLLFAQALNLDPTLKEIDTTKGEHLTPEFIKLNPQHTIPLIVDDNFVLSESRAILVYLAEQYAPGSLYYPNDPRARGVIHQRLLFDVGTLYARFWEAYMPLITKGQQVEVSKVNKLKEAFEFLESFMGDANWMAGDEITIADFSLVATISSIEACGFDLSQYKKIKKWLERCRNEMTDYEDINGKGNEFLENLVKEKLKQ